jgi:hypothetical protein
MPREPNSVAATPWTSTHLSSLFPLIGLLASAGASIAFGLPTGLLVFAGALLLIGIWNLWISLQTLVGDLPGQLEPMGPATIPKELEQKAFLLQALQDLDFERKLGKVDEQDYQELKSLYRKRAKEALQQEESTPSFLRQAEAQIESFLRQQHTDSKSSPPSETQPTITCGSCKTVNDSDSRFCKQCGKKFSAKNKQSKGGRR